MTEHKCKHSVTSDGWHFHECGRPAKYVYTHIWMGRKITEFLCGSHSRIERKYFPDSVKTIEEYEKCPQN